MSSKGARPQPVPSRAPARFSQQLISLSGTAKKSHAQAESPTTHEKITGGWYTVGIMDRPACPRLDLTQAPSWESRMLPRTRYALLVALHFRSSTMITSKSRSSRFSIWWWEPFRQATSPLFRRISSFFPPGSVRVSCASVSQIRILSFRVRSGCFSRAPTFTRSTRTRSFSNSTFSPLFVISSPG
jgi:hypothetical protein